MYRIGAERCTRIAPVRRENCAHFWAPSPSKTIAIGHHQHKTGLDVSTRKTNLIADHRSQSQIWTSQLLTEGLLVRI
jgi:hypothetical protein